MSSRSPSDVHRVFSTQRSESRRSSNSSYSDGGSYRHHIATLDIYGNNEDGHRALCLGRQGERKASMHHVRQTSHDTDDFEYLIEERPRKTQAHTGCSNLGRFSSRERNLADTSLREYGHDVRNLPKPHHGENCHNFTTGTVGVLESHRYLPAGSRAFWETQNHRRVEDVAANCHRDGRHFELTRREQMDGPADYAFGRDTEERRPMGKINVAAFEHLLSRERRG